MSEIKKEQLKKIEGGFDLNGTMLNYMVKGVEAIFDIGRSIGTAIRRTISGNICPL